MGAVPQTQYTDSYYFFPLSHCSSIQRDSLLCGSFSLSLSNGEKSLPFPRWDYSIFSLLHWSHLHFHSLGPCLTLTPMACLFLQQPLSSLSPPCRLWRSIHTLRWTASAEGCHRFGKDSRVALILGRSTSVWCHIFFPVQVSSVWGGEHGQKLLLAHFSADSSCHLSRLGILQCCRFSWPSES